MNILITGGAGFIGTKLAERLSKENEIIILDNFSPQIHGENYKGGFLYNKAREFGKVINGDIRDSNLMSELVEKSDIIYHLAAETGTGQSMYECYKYYDVNVSATALLCDVLLKFKNERKKVILTSSRAVYGEGRYICKKCGDVYPIKREISELEKGQFEPLCPKCKNILQVASTNEESQQNPTSIYGLTKKAQEELLFTFCIYNNIPVTVFRLQNVYGPGQSLANPYTGILSIFSSLILKDKEIDIFEDGKESRDFIFIDDAVNALATGIQNNTDNDFFNVGTGIATTVIDVIDTLYSIFNKKPNYKISGNFRIGDIRHNIADISKLKRQTGIDINFKFQEGVKEFIQWVLKQGIPESKYEESLIELKTKGLLK